MPSHHSQQNKKAFRSSSESFDFNVVRERGLEPPHLAAPDPKSGASAIPPFPHMRLNGGSPAARTRDTLIKSQVLYQLS